MSTFGSYQLIGLDACSVVVHAVVPGLLAPSEMLAVVAYVLNVAAWLKDGSSRRTGSG